MQRSGYSPTPHQVVHVIIISWTETKKVGSSASGDRGFVSILWCIPSAHRTNFFICWRLTLMSESTRMLLLGATGRKGKGWVVCGARCSEIVHLLMLRGHDDFSYATGQWRGSRSEGRDEPFSSMDLSTVQREESRAVLNSMRQL